jgi:hypothetical protein
MRKLVILFGLVVIPLVCFAQGRTNIYQKSINVEYELTSSYTIALPYDSRDLIVRNDDTADTIWVDLTAKTDKYSPGPGQILLPYGESIELFDYITSGVTVGAYNGEASPVTVISTY